MPHKFAQRSATRTAGNAVRAIVFAFLTSTTFVSQILSSEPARDEKPKSSATAITLGQIATGDAQLVDLTHALDEKSPFWPGDDYQPFQLKTIATLEKNGVSSKSFAMPEHFGTHLDAPCHFEKGQVTVDQIADEDLFAEGVVIDITPAAEADPDYRLTPADLKSWEQEHGPIPQRSIVLLKTGWSRHWSSNARYRNQDAMGKMHFPGYSADAARWLIKERNVRGIGIDTLSIDHGPSKDFIVHHIINGAGRYGLENVAAIDKLPSRNFFLLVAPIKIASGTGGPTRLFAVMPRSK